MSGRATQPRGRETDERGMRWRVRTGRLVKGWRRIFGGRTGLARRPRMWVLGPHIVMPDRVGGVPQMTGCPCADDMYPEGGVNMEGDLMDGSGRRDLEGDSPLGTISSL